MNTTKELNDIILRNKLYAVIEFFYYYDENTINSYLPNMKLSVHAEAFIQQALYMIYYGVGKRDDIPNNYAKLFTIEDAIVMLYDEEDKTILDILYNNVCSLINMDELTFMKLVEDVKQYDEYKELFHPRMHLFKECRKEK